MIIFIINEKSIALNSEDQKFSIMMIDYKLLFFAPLQKKKCAQLFFKSLYSTLSVHFVYPYIFKAMWHLNTCIVTLPI